jgi:hypothetical protein
MHPPPSDIIRSAPQLHSTKRLQMNAPLSKGRLCFLLTPQLNTFWLTKVNKLHYNEQIINELQTTNCNTQLQQKAAELTKLLSRGRIKRCTPTRGRRLSTPATHGKKLLFSFGFLLFTFE